MFIWKSRSWETFNNLPQCGIHTHTHIYMYVYITSGKRQMEERFVLTSWAEISGIYYNQNCTGKIKIIIKKKDRNQWPNREDSYFTVFSLSIFLFLKTERKKLSCSFAASPQAAVILLLSREGGPRDWVSEPCSCSIWADGFTKWLWLAKHGTPSAESVMNNKWSSLPLN